MHDLTVSMASRRGTWRTGGVPTMAWRGVACTGTEQGRNKTSRKLGELVSPSDCDGSTV